MYSYRYKCQLFSIKYFGLVLAILLLALCLFFCFVLSLLSLQTIVEFQNSLVFFWSLLLYPLSIHQTHVLLYFVLLQILELFTWIFPSIFVLALGNYALSVKCIKNHRLFELFSNGFIDLWNYGRNTSCKYVSNLRVYTTNCR